MINTKKPDRASILHILTVPRAFSSSQTGGPALLEEAVQHLNSSLTRQGGCGGEAERQGPLAFPRLGGVANLARLWRRSQVAWPGAFLCRK